VVDEWRRSPDSGGVSASSFPRLQCISGRKMLVKDKEGAMNRTLHRGSDVRCKSGRPSCYKQDRRCLPMSMIWYQEPQARRGET
jgi:hypothetical protein